MIDCIILLFPFDDWVKDDAEEPGLDSVSVRLAFWGVDDMDLERLTSGRGLLMRGWPSSCTDVPWMDERGVEFVTSGNGTLGTFRTLCFLLDPEVLRIVEFILTAPNISERTTFPLEFTFQWRSD